VNKNNFFVKFAHYYSANIVSVKNDAVNAKDYLINTLSSLLKQEGIEE
jgi:hypothetical protein